MSLTHWTQGYGPARARLTRPIFIGNLGDCMLFPCAGFELLQSLRYHRPELSTRTFINPAAAWGRNSRNGIAVDLTEDRKRGMASQSSSLGTKGHRNTGRFWQAVCYPIHPPDGSLLAPTPLPRNQENRAEAKQESFHDTVARG